MGIPKKAARIWPLALLLGHTAARAAGPALAEDQLVYDASISFIRAGRATLTRCFMGTEYGLDGVLKTSVMLKPFFSWSGRVAVTGSWPEQDPVTQSYLLDSVGRKGRRELTVVYQDTASQYRSDRGWQERDVPEGTDVMSVLFMSPSCFSGSFVHDGEDSYPIMLRRSREESVRLGRKHYAGKTLRCDYSGEDLKGRRRNVSVWLAQPTGTHYPAPVKIQVSVPRMPAGILLLRVKPKSSLVDTTGRQALPSTGQNPGQGTAHACRNPAAQSQTTE